MIRLLHARKNVVVKLTGNQSKSVVSVHPKNVSVLQDHQDLEALEGKEVDVLQVDVNAV